MCLFARRLKLPATPAELIWSSCFPGKLLHSDGEFITKPAEILQADGYSGPLRYATRHEKVHLVVPGITGSGSEVQHLRKPSANDNLRSDHTSVGQAGGVHRYRLSGDGRVFGRGKLAGLCVPDGA